METEKKPSIKDLAKRLKEKNISIPVEEVKKEITTESVNKKEDSVNKKEHLENGNKDNSVNKTRKVSTKSSGYVSQLIEKLKEEDNDLNYESQLYIDSDIHTILKKLKSNHGLKINAIANYLFDQFINQHIDEISELIKEKKRNRYLE